MADNFFDQFDAKPQPALAPAGSSNFFDKFDSASPAQMAVAQQSPSFASQLGSAFMRPVIKGVSGIPGMAADAGVGLRNLAESATNRYAPKVAEMIYAANRKLAGNSDALASVLPGGQSVTPYEGLTPQFNQAIDAVYTPPSGIAGKGAEFASSVLLGSRMPAPEIANPAPAGFITPAQALRNATLQSAQREGYVVPPSSNNPTATNRILEGIAGKVKLSQEAMMRNQGVTDELAARALGQNPEVPLTQEGLAAIRAEAHAVGYEPVKAAGQMSSDAKFLDALNDITKAAKGASRSFPGLAPKTQINDVVDALKQDKFDAGDAVDAISYLRGLADDAYSAGQASAGRSYKAAAKAVEDVIERNLADPARGQNGEALLSSYRDARQLIAQTYTAAKGLTDTVGTNNALAYANALRSGKPLVDDQRAIGEFASRFGKFAGVPKEIYPAISPLDAHGAVIEAGLTHSALPLALPLTRMGLREFLLSPQGQAWALAHASQAPTTMGTVPSAISQLPGTEAIYGPVR